MFGTITVVAEGTLNVQSFEDVLNAINLYPNPASSNLKREIYALFLCGISAFFYGIANVLSRYIKEVDVKFSNMIMGLTGFITILIFFSCTTCIK